MSDEQEIEAVEVTASDRACANAWEAGPIRSALAEHIATYRAQVEVRATRMAQRMEREAIAGWLQEQHVPERIIFAVVTGNWRRKP